MAYRMRHQKRNGDVSVSIVAGDTETPLYSRRQLHDGLQRSFGIVCKGGPRKKRVGYNFHPSMSAAKRNAEIKADLDRQRSECTSTKGWTKKKTMKKVASIPAELYWSHVAENGPGVFSDRKELKRFCHEWQLNVSKW